MAGFFPTAHFIKEIGRGAKGARSLSRVDARDLFEAILNGNVADLELGAILLAMRIKGESVEEMAGFLESAEASFKLISAPVAEYAPIVIPSYNGARRVANLTPLLAILLARAGAPVLVHGVRHDAGRVTSCEIFKVLGVQESTHFNQAEGQLGNGSPIFMPIDSLAPKLAFLLELRKKLGVRNSTHTLVKIIQPFVQPALRLASYTHPAYLDVLTELFTEASIPSRGDVFLMRGTEGETVANTKKIQPIEWFHAGKKTTLIAGEPGLDTVLGIPVDAEGTASWINDVLAGREAVPMNIAEQVRHSLVIAKQVNKVSPNMRDEG